MVPRGSRRGRCAALAGVAEILRVFHVFCHQVVDQEILHFHADRNPFRREVVIYLLFLDRIERLEDPRMFACMRLRVRIFPLREQFLLVGEMLRGVVAN